MCTYLNKIVKFICHNLKCNEYNTIKITIFKICVICYTKISLKYTSTMMSISSSYDL